jgi:hypothetical protein
MLDSVAKIAAVVSPLKLANIDVEWLSLIYITFDKSNQFWAIGAIEYPLIASVVW